MMTVVLWFAQTTPPATIALTTTQLTIALLLGVVSAVAAGVAFGRLTERQKVDHITLHETLETFKTGLAALTTSVNELRSHNQSGREEMIGWRLWRVVTDERLGEHDDIIGILRKGHDTMHTRVVVLEDRRSGPTDRRTNDG